MKKILILSSVLFGAVFVSQMNAGFAEVKTANFAQISIQKTKTAMAQRSYDSALSNLEKLKNDRNIMDRNILLAEKDCQEKKIALDSMTMSINQMQKARDGAANTKATEKEQSRVNAINSKASAASEKAEMEALKAKYDAKLNITMPGLTKKYARYKEMQNFEARNKALENSGMALAQRKTTLIQEFRLS